VTERPRAGVPASGATKEDLQMSDIDLGTLTVADGRCVLTFTRTLAHAQDKVWRAITEAEHRRHWFPDEVVGEFRPGAPLTFVVPGHDAFHGEVLVFDPPSVLELRWGDDRLRFELQPTDGGTVLTMTDTFDELGKAARDAAGWHECLDRLVDALDDTASAEPGTRWRAVHPRYVAALGPEASTIGPPG
jgi:uncharacterized protein YndB with AHSA1/START domain